MIYNANIKINMRASGDSYVCELGEYHGQQNYYVDDI